jgi:hypothetical protein
LKITRWFNARFVKTGFEDFTVHGFIVEVVKLPGKEPSIDMKKNWVRNADVEVSYNSPT